MDAKQIFDHIMNTSFLRCELPQGETRNWVSGKTELDGVYIEMVFNNEVDSAQVALTAEIVTRLEGLTPFKANRHVVKCHVDVDSVIRVHNLHPKDAVAIALAIYRDWGFISQYHAGARGFSDTLFISVAPGAFGEVA